MGINLDPAAIMMVANVADDITMIQNHRNIFTQPLTVFLEILLQYVQDKKCVALSQEK